MNDTINHPVHYTSNPGGVECITVAEHMTFCVGNVIKYCWRAGLKGPAIEDLKKARWYLDREISRLEGHVSETWRHPTNVGEGEGEGGTP